MARSLARNKDFARGAAGLFSRLAQDILREEAGAIEGQDVEYVHRMRTSTNRLRAAIRLMAGPARLRAEPVWRADLKWLAGALAAARDLDVLIGRVGELARARAAGSVAAAVARVEDEFRARRAEAYAALRRSLRSKKWRRVKRHLTRLAGGDKRLWRSAKGARKKRPRAALRAVVAPVLETFKARRRNMLEEMTAARTHKFRLAAKRLRYVCEFFQFHMGADGPRLTLFFKGLSDCLGELHDLEILDERLSAMSFAMLAGGGAPDGPALAGLRALLRRCRARKRVLHGQFAALWRRLHAPRNPLERLDALAAEPADNG